MINFGRDRIFSELIALLLKLRRNLLRPDVMSILRTMDDNHRRPDE